MDAAGGEPDVAPTPTTMVSRTGEDADDAPYLGELLDERCRLSDRRCAVRLQARAMRACTLRLLREPTSCA